MEIPRSNDLVKSEPASNRPRLTPATYVLYGVGAIAFIVDNPLMSWLLLFFNQVVGLSAARVAAAMMVALIFDAICAPLIGDWSDHTNSRWGRRHPFMYASAIPAALSLYLLFNPPLEWSQRHLFNYLVVVLVSLRLFLFVLYAVPSSALLPELTYDYDQRTTLLSWRFFFGLLGAASISLLAFQVFLRKDATHPLGLLNRAGYGQAAIVASIMVFLSIMISCLGTHRFIRSVVQEPRTRGRWPEKIKEVAATLCNRSFLALAISGIVGAIADGLVLGLGFYVLAYFWEFTPAQISYLVVGGTVAAFVGVGLAPAISKRFGKKPAAIGLSFAALFTGIAPIPLRLLGMLPPNGAPAIFPMNLFASFISGTLATAGNIIGFSMLADVVEDAAVTTGQRSEGLLFATNGLIAKCVAGFGTFLSGLILAWVSFPQHATPGQVDPATLHHLGTVYVGAIAIFYALEIVVLIFYNIDRSTHENNLEQLKIAD